MQLTATYEGREILTVIADSEAEAIEAIRGVLGLKAVEATEDEEAA